MAGRSMRENGSLPSSAPHCNPPYSRRMTRIVTIYPMDEVRRINRCPECLLVPPCGCTIVPLTDDERNSLPLASRLALMDATTKFLARREMLS